MGLHAKVAGDVLSKWSFRYHLDLAAASRRAYAARRGGGGGKSSAHVEMVPFSAGQNRDQEVGERVGRVYWLSWAGPACPRLLRHARLKSNALSESRP